MPVAALTVMDIVLTLIAGVWVPLLILGFFYVARLRSYRFQPTGVRAQTELAREQQAQLAELSHRFESFFPALMERLPERVAESVGKETHRDIRELQAAVSDLKDSMGGISESGDETATPGQRQLLREVSHALNTPLSQVEAAAVSTGRRLEANDADPESIRQLKQIAVSVTICKAFLFSFRLLASGSTLSEHESPLDLNTALRQAAELYADLHHKEITLDLETIVEISDYDGSYVLATLLPLLENAVESAPEQTEIRLAQETHSSATLIEISNELSQPMPTDIYDPGRTSKPGHDGLGLATVQRLLQGAQGSLSHSVQAGTVTFTLAFPSRRG